MSTIVSAAVVAVVAVVATACAGSAGAERNRASAADRAACAPARPPGSATVVARDDRFDPSCIEVAPGSTVTLVVRNAGHHPHNLTLADGSRAHVAVDAGQAGFVTATVGSADVAFSCTIHRGMRGIVRVDRPLPG